ncbi:MAG: lipopolysaccharide biosynthesis protein [Phycicoccus sp.]|nr:lipopolysaccharide biosynthesis protein [Phycicoccus sp.]
MITPPRRLSLDDVEPEALSSRGAGSLVGLVAANGAKFFTSWAAGRAGDKVLLGAVAVSTSSAQLLSLVGPTSIGAAASKYMALALGEGDLATSRAVAGYLRRMALLTSLPLSAVAVVLTFFYYHRSLSEALAVGALTLGLSGYAVARGLFFGHRHIAASARWDILTASGAMLGTAACWLLGVHSVLIVLPLALSMLVYTWAGWPRGAGGPVSPALAKDIRHFTAFAAAGTLSSAGFVQASQLAAEHYGGGDAGAGFYSAAFLLAAPLTIMVGAANQVLYPSMSEALGRGQLDAFRGQLAAATQIVSVLMTGAIGVLVVASPLVLRLVWGPGYAPAEPLLPLLLTGVLATSVAVPGVSALTTRSAAGAGRTALYSLIGAAAGGLVWLTCAPRFGVVAVAGGGLVAAATTAAFVLWRVSRDEQVPVMRTVLRVAVGLLLAATLWALPRELHAPLWVSGVTAAVFFAVWVLLTRSTWLMIRSRLTAP